VSRRSRRREAAPRDAGARPEETATRPKAATDRQRKPPAGEAPARGEPTASGAPERTPDGPLSRLGVQLLLLAAVFVAAVLVAELFGAANLGVAFGVGQIAFAIAVVYLILRR
jgi:hypothetical protein